MKKMFFVLLALLFCVNAYSADTKVSNLTELETTPADSDELYINDGGTSKKIRYSNLLSNIDEGNMTTAAGTKRLSATFDPSSWYDQESTYRSFPLFKIGSEASSQITLLYWSVAYVGGDPTTELDADLICDTTPDYNTAAGATVMDVLDTTAGASGATSGFDSSTCATGSTVYIHFGADPTDANVAIAFNMGFKNL